MIWKCWPSCLTSKVQFLIILTNCPNCSQTPFPKLSQSLSDPSNKPKYCHWNWSLWYPFPFSRVRRWFVFLLYHKLFHNLFRVFSDTRSVRTDLKTTLFNLVFQIDCVQIFICLSEISVYHSHHSPHNTTYFRSRNSFLWFSRGSIGWICSNVHISTSIGVQFRYNQHNSNSCHGVFYYCLINHFPIKCKDREKVSFKMITSLFMWDFCMYIISMQCFRVHQHSFNTKTRYTAFENMTTSKSVCTLIIIQFLCISISSFGVTLIRKVESFMSEEVYHTMVPFLPVSLIFNKKYL